MSEKDSSTAEVAATAEENEEKIFSDGNYSVVDSADKSEETDENTADAEKSIKSLPDVKKENVDVAEVTSSSVEMQEIDSSEVKVEAAATEEDPAKEISEIKDDSLIITHEDDLDSIAPEEKTEVTSTKSPSPLKEASPEKKKVDGTASNKPKDAEEKPTKAKIKPEDVNYVWVSNISRHVKATDLKKYFSRHGKVLTAKIVTNGKSLFGYVSLETHELAIKCIEVLHDTIFEGKRITVSMERPDNPKKQAIVEEKKTVVPKQTKNGSTKTRPDKIEIKDKKDPLTKKYKPEEAKPEPRKIEVDWRGEYQRVRNENDRVRRRMLDSNRRYETMQNKCRRLELNIKNLEQQVKDERRRFNKEKEDLERKNTADAKRFDEDRLTLNKEMDEVIHLREHLKMKIKEVEMRVHKHHKTRSPSPRRVTQTKRFEEKKKWTEDRMHRSPPPPPKLSEPRKRTTEPMRHYYEEKKAKRSPPSQYSFNESRGRSRPDVKPISVRNTATPWTSASYQEPWRMQSSMPNTQQFTPVDRYPPYPVAPPFMTNSLGESNFYRPTEYPKYDSRKY